MRMDDDTYCQDSENKSGILEVVFKTEMYLSDIFRRFCVVNVHVDQRYRATLQEGHLKHIVMNC